MGSTALSRRAVYLGGVLVFAWLYMAGSQCTPATLMAACEGRGLPVAAFLETDILPSSSVDIRCDAQSVALSGWSHSPGTVVVTDLLDISLPKYMVNGNTLTITNINRTDEGVYRCIYGNGNSPEWCIYVYGRAVFASCPDDVNGCPDDVSLTVEEGGSVSFDATVIHTPGGSCGFQQRIDTVQLIRLNPVFGINDDQLLFCDTSEVSCSNSNASLSRGNDPGYEFVFTLNNALLERDNRRFRVSVHLTHPTSGSTEQIEKNFVLQVTPRPSSSTGTPETDSPSMDTTVTDTEPGVATDTVEQRRSSLTIIIGVLVPVVLIIILIAVVLAIIMIVHIQRTRSRTQDDPLVNEKAPESHIIAQEVNTDNGRGEKVLSNPPTNLDRTQEVTPQAEQPPPYYATVSTEQPRKSIELNRINNEEPKPTEPSFYDNRESLIESDFHLPTDTNLNSRPQLVTICEGHEVEAEQTGSI